MGEISTIGLDLAKHVFQVHGVDEQGNVVVRKVLRRGAVLKLFAELSPCTVGIKACSTAHYWARELTALGHMVRLMPPAYVKPYVKRGKNDAADAEAICEAVRRPTMRFVPVKSAEEQANAMVYKVRELLVRQRTQLIKCAAQPSCGDRHRGCKGARQARPSDRDRGRAGRRLASAASAAGLARTGGTDRNFGRSDRTAASGDCCSATLERDRTSADDRSGRWAADRRRFGRDGARSRRIPFGEAFCKLVGLCPTAEVQRRQATAGINQQTRQPLSAESANPRCSKCSAPQKRFQIDLARSLARATALQGRRRGAGAQDRPHRLGTDGQRRKLSCGHAGRRLKADRRAAADRGSKTGCEIAR